MTVYPIALFLLLHTERSISQIVCTLKEVLVLADEYTFLWKSMNLRQKSLSFQRRLNSEVAFEEKSERTSFLDFVTNVCKRIARFTSPTNNITLYTRIYKGIYKGIGGKSPQFLLRLKSEVSLGLSNEKV